MSEPGKGAGSGATTTTTAEEPAAAASGAPDEASKGAAEGAEAEGVKLTSEELTQLPDFAEPRPARPVEPAARPVEPAAKPAAEPAEPAARPAEAAPRAAGRSEPTSGIRTSSSAIPLIISTEPTPSTRLSSPFNPTITASMRIQRLSAQLAAVEPIPDDADFISDDPVEIAALLLQRARSDLAELRGHYHRLDLLVLLLALLLIVVAGRFYERLVTPPAIAFAERGLTFQRSQGWLSPEPVAPISPRLLQRTDAPPALVRREPPYHVAFTFAGDASARLEVLIDQKPAWSNIVTGLDLVRRTRWGELYSSRGSAVRSIAGHDWLRTSYRYAHAVDKGDPPRVDGAVEYATVGRDRLYVISLFGTDDQIELMEETIAPTLRVETRTGAPLLPLEGRLRDQLERRAIPEAVAVAFRSTVMVVVADLVDGQLRARGGGSGVVVGRDGSIVTNFHVVHDKNGRMHDLFVIGRYTEPDRAPQLWCAGSPSRSKLQPESDLALLKCDLDLDGRTWSPGWSGGWSTLPSAPLEELEQGQRLWVLGYPDVGGGGLTASFGVVEGWTGEDRGLGRDFIKTDASITHGNSGGPVVNDQGELVGIATAFRTKIKVDGGVIETSKIGLVRPRDSANDLVAIAAAGWTPREGHTKVELALDAIEPPAEGVRLETHILDAANDKPIADALLMVLRSGVRADAIDMNRLDDQVISWGRANSAGEVRLKHPVPVPGAYSVLVFARGYAPLIGDQELRLTATTPPGYDPWGAVRLTR